MRLFGAFFGYSAPPVTFVLKISEFEFLFCLIKKYFHQDLHV
jgi:hypothetical protein